MFLYLKSRVLAHFRTQRWIKFVFNRCIPAFCKQLIFIANAINYHYNIESIAKLFFFLLHFSVFVTKTFRTSLEFAKCRLKSATYVGAGILFFFFVKCDFANRQGKENWMITKIINRNEFSDLQKPYYNMYMKMRNVVYGETFLNTSSFQSFPRLLYIIILLHTHTHETHFWHKGLYAHTPKFSAAFAGIFAI